MHEGNDFVCQRGFGMCVVAFVIRSRGLWCNWIQPLACNSRNSHVLIGDSHSSLWESLNSCCTCRESRFGSARLQIQMWVSRRSFDSLDLDSLKVDNRRDNVTHDLAHKLRANIPTAPYSPTCPSHLPFCLGHILNGATF